MLTETQLHGQTGQTYTQAEPPVKATRASTTPNVVLSATKRPERTELHDQTNTQAESPVATTSNSSVTDAVLITTELLEQTQLHDRADTQAESPAAAISTTPAADSVLSTTELLEQILSHFDIKDLVSLRRVSRHWSDVMAESSVFQRAMFLAPEPELPFEWHLQEDTSFDEPDRYTKERSSSTSKADYRVSKSSRLNPLLFNTRLDIGIDETHALAHSARIYPRRNLKVVRASKLFSRMLVAQPPFDWAYVGCQTTLLNLDGIRVSDLIHIMEYDDEHACDFGHVFSLVVPRFIFPTRDEEEEGQVLRWYRDSNKHCTDLHERSRIIATTLDGGHSVLKE